MNISTMDLPALNGLADLVRRIEPFLERIRSIRRQLRENLRLLYQSFHQFEARIIQIVEPIHLFTEKIPIKAPLLVKRLSKSMTYTAHNN